MLTPNEKDKSMTALSQFKKLINYKILGTEIELKQGKAEEDALLGCNTALLLL